MDAVTDRLGRLQRIAEALARVLSAPRLADVVIREISTDLGAKPLLWLLNESRAVLELIEPHGHARAAPYAEIPLDAELPGAAVVRSGVAMFVTGRAERPENLPGDAAFAVFPLSSEHRVSGVLAVGYPGPHHFDAGERGFLQAVADLTAAALERARLHDAERRGAERLRFLVDASSALAGSLDYHETLARVVRLIVPRMAEMATVHLYDEHGELRRVALAHHDQAVEAALLAYVEAHAYEVRNSNLEAVAREAHPVVVRDAAAVVAHQAAVDAEHARLLESLAITSGVAIPLVTRGDPLGVVTFLRCGGAPPYGPEDEALAAEVARRAAVAVENARLHSRRAEVASLLQASLLPPELPTVPGIELAAAYHPAGEGIEVGGDFYDVFRVDDHRWAFMIGDVAGTGPAAAARTALVRHTARAIARTGAAPADVVAAVDDALTTGDVERFCTMIFGVATGADDGVALDVVGAGHPPPLLVTADGAVTTVELGGTLLGVLPDTPHEVRSLRLHEGDTLLLYTDGVIECRPPRPGVPLKLFGEDGLADAARGVGGSAARLVRAVEDALRQFAGGAFADDIALLGIRASRSR